MKTNFSVQQIADIAKKVHTYKVLFVTTRGQMFRNRIDAEESVRTLNLIIDDANEHVGILELTSDMVSADKLKTFGKSPTLFGKLFDNAKIPVSKTDTKKDFKRSREDTNVVDDSADAVEIALGIKADKATPASDNSKK